MTAKFCGNCARADCNQAGLVEVCERWSDTDDLITTEEIERDLAPLSREECERRGLAHSSSDDHRLVKYDLLFDCDLRNAYEGISAR